MAVAAMRESSMCDDVDRALVEALRLRKPAAAERLVAAYRSTAHRWAQRVTGQAADAEEVAQDALWTVILKIDTFQGNAPFAPGCTESSLTPPTRRSATAVLSRARRHWTRQ
jgi:sigma-70-like protein